MNKLIGLEDFVLEIEQKTPKATNFSSFTTIVNYEKEMYSKIISYANFLKQSLTLGMFIPTDENGNVLELPTPQSSFSTINYELRTMDYQQVKSKVIFEGFEVKEQDEETTFISNGIIKIYFSNNEIEFETNDYNGYLETIKDLIPYNLTLTDKN